MSIAGHDRQYRVTERGDHAQQAVDVTFQRDMILGGRYQLTHRIAGGGMGEVWAATDRILGRSVAVKLLKPELLDEPGFLDRFRAEARHTAALVHPGIASVFDYGEDRHVAYLVMELVDGEPLSAVLAREGALPLPTVLSILAQTSAALDAAHRAGVVHRDIKPGNLLVTPDGQVKITDFGISKLIGSVPLTATGQVLGTPQYISPEQATGSPATAASDFYSLGVIGFEMLAGRRPFNGDTPLALAMAHVHQNPPALPPTVPAALALVIEELLSKQPSDRPTDAGVLAGRLRSIEAADRPGVHDVAAPARAERSPAVPTVFHTAFQPSIATDPATEVAPARAALARDDSAMAPDELGRRMPARLWPAVVAFAAVLLLVVVAAVVASRNGDDSVLTDAGADSIEDTATSVAATVAVSAAVTTPVTVAPTEPPTTATATTAAATTAVPVFDPNVYIGLSADDARSLLEGLGFEVVERRVKHGGGDKDSVVGAELDPPAGGNGPGAPAGPVDSAGRVMLLVSDGK